MSEQIFENYLEYRIQKEGALTPGQKLELVQLLQQEARQGTVPSGENSVARVPLDSPVVQAVLRGEPISIGNTSVRRKTGIQNWSTGQKLALLGGGTMLFMLVFIVFFLLVSNSHAAAKPTATLEASSTPFSTETMEPTETPIPPPTETEVPTPALMIGVGSSPAEDANAPASIEIRGRLFVLQEGKVAEKTGTWNPQGPEWLNGTEVRRVIALPLAQLADLPVQPGDDVTLRTRNGRVVIYPLTKIVNLTLTQIEAFISLSPSIIVTLFDPAQANSTENPDRLVLIGELNTPPVMTATAIVQRAQVVSNVNLRVRPSVKGEVIAGLIQGTWLDISYPLQTRSAEGLVWVFVHSSFGNGWVARQYLSFQ